jgi:hypothetical protein
MATLAYLPAVGTLQLDRTLESIVQVHWNELMPAEDVGQVQVEYHADSDGRLQYMKIWASTARGQWHLVCEQWMIAAWSHVPGLQFSPPYYSEALGRALELVARHQNAFAPLARARGNGLLQISPPTEDERRAAQDFISEVLAGLGSSATEKLVTSWTGGKATIMTGSDAPVAAD